MGPMKGLPGTIGFRLREKILLFGGPFVLPEYLAP